MTPGFFDLPAPLLNWVDDRLGAVLPAGILIAFWAIVGGVACMELYRLTSPQRRIGQLKKEASEAQRRLAGYDGEMDEAWPLMRNMLGLSMKRVGIVIPGTLAAAYPVIVLFAFMSNVYGHYLPAAGDDVAVDVAAPLQARWQARDNATPPHVQALQPGGDIVVDVELTKPIPVLHKHAWWNALLANPAGYLPDDAPVDEMRIHLPQREFLAAGPGWLRGWEVIFFPVLFITALGYKAARHID